MNKDFNDFQKTIRGTLITPLNLSSIPNKASKKYFKSMILLCSI